MKKYIIFVSVILCALVMGASLESLNMAWETAVGGITATTPSPAATARKWADIPQALTWEADEAKNNVELAVISDAEGQTATLEVWAARQKGDMVLIFTSTLTTGSQSATGGGYYVDTATTTWNMTGGYREFDYGGSNRMTRWIWDGLGYRHYIFYFTAKSAGTWSVKASGV